MILFRKRGEGLIMIYIDVHTHQQRSFRPEDIRIVNTIVRKGEDDNCSSYRSYGIHPWYIEDISTQMNQLREYAGLPETRAIGEAGLDKAVGMDMALQTEVFRSQALLAEEVEKPLIIHCVKAWAELLEIKREVSPRMPWIAHGFRGKKELAEQLVRHGFYLSFGDVFNREAVIAAWPRFVLAETDDKTVDIQDVYRQIADSLPVPPEELAQRLEENSRHLFGLFE